MGEIPKFRKKFRRTKIQVEALDSELCYEFGQDCYGYTRNFGLGNSY